MASQLTESVGEGLVTRHGSTSFFFAMSGAFLAIVLIGFTPSLYLRGMLFPDQPMPGGAVTYAHGFVMTTWFLLFFVQTGLIRRGNFQRHRQLGVAGAFVGLGVVIAAVTTSLGVVPRLKGVPGFDFASDVSAIGMGAGMTVARLFSRIVWGNLAIAFSFSVLLVLAILFRRQPAVHKRLMLIASLAALIPALQRISRWPGLGGDAGPFWVIASALLFVPIVVHDLAVTKRVHPATLVGGGVVVFAFVAAQFISATEFGQTFMMGL